VPTTDREIEFRSRCLDDGRISKSHFYIYLLSQLQHILQNLDWLQLKFDFVSGQERPLLVQNFHPV
jgi:hypothetical protein